MPQDTRVFEPIRSEEVGCIAYSGGPVCKKGVTRHLTGDLVKSAFTIEFGGRFSNR